jgi:hypothetical protein
VGLERGPLSLVSTSEELLERKSSGSCLKNREYVIGIRHAEHVAHFIRKKLALTTPTSRGRSAGIVRLRNQTTEFVLFLLFDSLRSSSLADYIINRVPSLVFKVFRQ